VRFRALSRCRREIIAATKMQRWWKWKRQDLSGYQIRKLSRKHRNMLSRKIDGFERTNLARIQSSREVTTHDNDGRTKIIVDPCRSFFPSSSSREEDLL
jgi:hypothetical protein